MRNVVANRKENGRLWRVSLGPGTALEAEHKSLHVNFNMSWRMSHE